MTDTSTLTRSKLVTREISETMQYTHFGKDNVAVKVNVVVTGVDPFKSEHHAIMQRKEFDTAMKAVAKSKLDFPYRDLVIKKDASYHWHCVTAAEMKSFGEFPADDLMSTNLYAFVTGSWEADEKLSTPEREAARAARTKKVYTNAVTKNGAGLIRFNHSDHTGWYANGKLVVQPVIIDYGLRSGQFKIKKMVTKLRELDNFHMRLKTPGRFGSFDFPYADFPEITRIPHYNAETDDETEISLWFLPTEEQYNELRGGKEYVSISTWELMERGMLPIEEFKKETDDD